MGVGAEIPGAMTDDSCQSKEKEVMILEQMITRSEGGG
jgi:hypothetical protein